MASVQAEELLPLGKNRFHSPLDPATPHSVLVTNLAEDNQSSFDVSKVIFLTADFG